MPSGTQTPKTISFALTGSGGSGVITAGSMILEAASQAGKYGLFMRSSGPQIRGGEAAAMIQISDNPVDAPDDAFDIMVSIDWHNIDRFAVELPLTENSLVLYDPENGDVPEIIAKTGAKLVALPMKKRAKAIKKGRQNMIAAGAIARLTGIQGEALDQVMVKVLAKRGEEALSASREAVASGSAAAEDFGVPLPDVAKTVEAPQRWMISGNEAAGLGALRGGIRFVAAYPITPATELLEWMAPNLKKVGGALVQAEDELASINMIIGSSYGGTPSLTATSGPGLALMSESFGLAVASEVPLVVVNVMRGGPSTGIPTKSEQSDLNIALFGLHGDAPHLVVAPQSVSDCVFSTQWATNLTEVTQTPAIVLSDQLLGQTKAVIDRPADIAFAGKRKIAEAGVENYQRYALGGNSVSAMSVPGNSGGQYTADGLTHNQRGLPSSQDTDHLAQMDKRRDKIQNHDYGDHWAEVDGDGALAIIAWGSTVSAVRRALAQMPDGGKNIRVIAQRLLAPALPERMAEALAGVEKALVIELSHSAQFYHYLKGYFDLPCPTETYHRPGPLPFRPRELSDIITKWSGS